jgi:hypothetical protein
MGSLLATRKTVTTSKTTIDKKLAIATVMKRCSRIIRRVTLDIPKETKGR